MSSILVFIGTTVFPDSPAALPDREAFLSELRTATLQVVLDRCLLPAMPTAMASVPAWLETVHAAVEVETKLIGSTSTAAIIQPFFAAAAGPAWAAQRRRRVAEEVRRLIISGWGGWEAIEAESEKEVVVMEEIEVDDEDDVDERVNGKGEDDDMDFGWDFDDEKKASSPGQLGSEHVNGTAMDVDQESGDWGLTDDTAPAGPSKPRQSPPIEPNSDGWEFDDVALSPPRPAAQPKPAREAKRLGRKVLKVKAVADDDEWGLESEAMGSSAQDNGHAPDVAPTDDWGDWNGDHDLAGGSNGPPGAPVESKTRKRAVREIKRTIKETIMISRACEKLLETSERVLHEARDLRSTQSVDMTNQRGFS